MSPTATLTRTASTRATSARSATAGARRNPPTRGVARPIGKVGPHAKVASSISPVISKKGTAKKGARTAPTSVTATRARRSSARRLGKVPFVLLVCVVLTVGLLSLLLINTVLAQDSFVVNDLQKQQSRLTEQEAQLEADTARREAPNEVHKKAVEQGLVPAAGNGMVDPSARSVAGDPRPAVARR